MFYFEGYFENQFLFNNLVVIGWVGQNFQLLIDSSLR